jgi:hypothetical protein
VACSFDQVSGAIIVAPYRYVGQMQIEDAVDDEQTD